MTHFCAKIVTKILRLILITTITDTFLSNHDGVTSEVKRRYLKVVFVISIIHTSN